MRRSFAVRLAATFATVGLAAAMVTVLLVNIAFHSRFSDYLEQGQSERRAQLVASLAEAFDPGRGWDHRQLSRIAAASLMDGGTVRIESMDGELLWEWQREEWGMMRHQQMMDTARLGAQWRVPVDVAGRAVGVAVLRLPETGVLPQDVAFRTSVNRTLIVGVVAAGALALLLGAWFARRATAPARALTQTAQQLASGNHSARVPADRVDEFGAMARAFNRMADAAEAEDRLRRDFAADVAHELRTPLMILRGEVEALQDGVTSPTPQALASLHEETLRLARLVDDVETVARADAAGFSLDLSPAALDQITAEVAAEYAPMLAERSVTLVTATGDELIVDVDPTRIRQVVSNLMSNAAKFTPEGGQVRVTVERRADSAVIAVWNSGPAISDADLPHVFDRFYRGQRRAGGSGIGLTVVRDLVEAHGGTVEVTSTTEEGTTFLVRLPVDTRTGASDAQSSRRSGPVPA